MQIKTFVVNPIEVNCYLLWDDTGDAVLIDCGAWMQEERERIRGFVQSQGLKVRHYLNTHLHFDHIFGNAYIEETFGIKAEASDRDWNWAKTIGERVARFGIRYEEKVPPLGRVLDDGDEVLFGNQRIEVIAVPGHSPGSLAFHIPEHKVLFTGDALFCQSIGRTDFHDSNHTQLITAIREKLFALPDDTTVYPGHSEKTTIGFEKRYNIYLR
jgi:glyoxylase-like metal-dependent hydrolase (beta-lactamase superfamily II)